MLSKRHCCQAPAVEINLHSPEKMKLTARLFIILAAFMPIMPPRACALPDAEATAGRLILRRYADAIVSVKLTVTLKMVVNGRSMPPNESNVDVNGTVITPEGLTVASLSAVDSNLIFEALRAQMSQSVASLGLDKAEIKGMRLRLADGTEIPARIVGKDPTRDLVFIVPENPPAAGGRTFTCVDLREAPDAAMVLGNYYHLMRLSEAMQRAPVVRPSTVTGIIERPRRLLLISTDMFSDGVGCPVFDSQGKVLGICLRYVVGSQAKGIVVTPAVEVVDQTANF
jgi:hypothetical protein